MEIVELNGVYVWWTMWSMTETTDNNDCWFIILCPRNEISSVATRLCIASYGWHGGGRRSRLTSGLLYERRSDVVERHLDGQGKRRGHHDDGQDLLDVYLRQKRTSSMKYYNIIILYYCIVIDRGTVLIDSRLGDLKWWTMRCTLRGGGVFSTRRRAREGVKQESWGISLELKFYN